MIGTKNALLVDRRVYAYKGKWKSQKDDLEVNIYYFISAPMTLTESWENCRETIKPTIGITSFGEHAFCTHDIITLQDGTTFEIKEFTNNYFEPNIQVRDMVKQRVESQEITLE